MSEQVGNKQIIQGEDIVVTVDGKPTLHATNHSLKVDLEVKDHSFEYERSPYEELHRDGIHHLLLPRHSGWRQRHLQLHHHRKRQPHPG